MIAPARIALFLAMALSASCLQAQSTYQQFVDIMQNYSKADLDATSNPGSFPQIKIIQNPNSGTNTGQDKTYRGSGGEFIIQYDFGNGNGFENLEQPTDVGRYANTSPIYKTFCVEPFEYIGLPGTYTATMDEEAYFSTNQGSPPVQTLNTATQLLYGLYFEGRLEALTASLGSDQFFYENQVDAIALQDAIWGLEFDPIDMKTGQAGALQQWALNQVALNALPDDQNHVFLNGEVKVLNLWEGKQQKQSQLIYVPGDSLLLGPNGPVPEPTTAAIWGVGLALCGWQRHRQNRKRRA